MKKTDFVLIVYNCLDNFGKPYTFTETCRRGKISKVIAKAESKSTEIVSTTIQDIYVEDKAEKLFNAIFK